MKTDTPRQVALKLAKTWFKVAHIDKGKRSLITGLGAFVAACSAPQPEQAKQKKTAPAPYVSNTDPDNEDVASPGNQVVGCTTCPSTGSVQTGQTGKNPGSSFVPANTGSGSVINPITPPDVGGITKNPVAPPPAGGGAVSNPISPPTNTIVGPTLSVQTFTSLGPTIANLQASDMFAGITQTMSDGKPIIVWGFTDNKFGAFNSDKTRLSPGPVIEMIQGLPMDVSLISAHPHTIHLHGLDVDQANDGVPSTSGYVAMAFGPPRGRKTPGVNLGQIFTYKLIAPNAGTYLYHCHVDTVVHIEMGMYGTVIVRPPDGNRTELYAQGPRFDREYIWQLHTFDSTWHAPDRSPYSGVDTKRYTPDYFMINGRDGTDLLADTATAIQAYANQQIAIRLVNIGYMPAVVKLGGIAFNVHCSDGRPLKTPITGVFEWLVAPGERYDIMFTMPLKGLTSATVEYLDIMGRKILGTAANTITTL